jgi:hypothetical protein
VFPAFGTAKASHLAIRDAHGDPVGALVLCAAYGNEDAGKAVVLVRMRHQLTTGR